MYIYNMLFIYIYIYNIYNTPTACHRRTPIQAAHTICVECSSLSLQSEREIEAAAGRLHGRNHFVFWAVGTSWRPLGAVLETSAKKHENRNLSHPT